jgi:hypothetical protein
MMRDRGWPPSLHWALFVGLAAVATLGGCQKGIPRSEVHGKVTLDGKPIPQGDIRFVPVSGPAWSARIKDGNYTTAGTKGAPIGKLRVEIQAYRTPANTASGAAPATNDDAIPMEPYLPAKFNVESTMEMTIEQGEKSVEKDFELKS